ncbi:MAG: TrkH family potassium uptake protein, partial [Clostridiales Family XIII bacterium]|nr:TrkH family potassium uptake protein [Clostridiales Family XIII bacterium]
MKFNFHVILKISGVIAMIVALSMLPAAIISAVCGESEALRAFLLSMLPFFAAGCLIFVFTKPLSASLRMREGIFIVSWCWMLSSLLGSLPYMLCGAAPGFVDAFFESASAFTTTGATLMPDLEALPKGMFFWRALSNWLGGMGILIFAVSILPALGIGALNIAKAETPGPTLDKMTPRMSDSARLLYGIYIALTAAEFLLLVGRMGPFEAAVHSFASVGT